MITKAFIALLFPSICFAESFDFTYNLKNGNMVQTLRLNIEAKNHNMALFSGAMACEKFFDVKNLTENEKLELVDTCTNPDER
jgi:hypothetical protein